MPNDDDASVEIPISSKESNEESASIEIDLREPEESNEESGSIEIDLREPEESSEMELGDSGKSSQLELMNSDLIDLREQEESGDFEESSEMELIDSAESSEMPNSFEESSEISDESPE